MAGARFRYPIFASDQPPISVSTLLHWEKGPVGCVRVVVGLDGVLDALSAKRERAIWRSGRTRDALEL